MSVWVQSVRVALVGAGPGDRGLLTLRAAEWLARAEVLIYDRLVPAEIVALASRAQRIAVADLPGPHACRCEKVIELLVAEARRGRIVVRLKGGDPFIFGRGAEEALALQEAGIAYEIVPGVTAALAAACAGIPLTHRLSSSAVALVTGHESPDKSATPLDWSALARFPGTLVVYMGVKHLPEIVSALLRHGKPGHTPAAAIHWAATPAQRVCETTLAELPGSVARLGLTSPCLFVIGDVVRLRSRLQWWEKRPLFGRTVLVTRPIDQASDLKKMLEERGARVYTLPMLHIGPPEDSRAFDRVLQNLDRYDWIVFTSANGVHAFMRRLFDLGADVRRLGPMRLAAIGPKTAAALEHYYLRPDIVPKEYRSETLVDELREKVRGRRVLLARADRGRELLRSELEKIAEVTEVAVYSQKDLASLPEDIGRRLANGEIHVITVTSSNIARALVQLCNDALRQRLGRDIAIASISPVTSATLRDLGIEPAIEARVYTAEGLVEALVQWAQANSRIPSQEI